MERGLVRTCLPYQKDIIQSLSKRRCKMLILLIGSIDYAKEIQLTSISRLIDELTRLETIKTWSLIVTLFGDLDNDNQVRLSGKDIKSILAHIGIKPEAVRVALHRLKKQGWIITEKSGREVLYFLSRRGLAETAAVYNDVYSPMVKYPNGWRLVLQEGEPMLGGIRLSRNLAIFPKDFAFSSEKAVALKFTDKILPNWLENQIVASPTLALAGHLEILLNNHKFILETLSPLDEIAIRLLFLHRWRKLALRTAVWAHIGLFENGSLAKCHQGITSWLAGTPKLTTLLLKR